MEQQTPTMKDRQAALLSDDPGRFEPATAFRVAQLVSADDGIVVGAHGGTQPTPLAITPAPTGHDPSARPIRSTRRSEPPP